MTRSTASRRARNSDSVMIGGRRRPDSRPSRRRCRLASSRVEPLTARTSLADTGSSAGARASGRGRRCSAGHPTTAGQRRRPSQVGARRLRRLRRWRPSSAPSSSLVGVWLSRRPGAAPRSAPGASACCVRAWLGGPSRPAPPVARWPGRRRWPCRARPASPSPSGPGRGRPGGAGGGRLGRRRTCPGPSVGARLLIGGFVGPRRRARPGLVGGRRLEDDQRRLERRPAGFPAPVAQRAGWPAGRRRWPGPPAAPAACAAAGSATAGGSLRPPARGACRRRHAGAARPCRPGGGPQPAAPLVAAGSAAAAPVRPAALRRPAGPLAPAGSLPPAGSPDGGPAAPAVAALAAAPGQPRPAPRPPAVRAAVPCRAPAGFPGCRLACGPGRPGCGIS